MTWRETQMALNGHGYQVAVDGMPGPQTYSALFSYMGAQDKAAAFGRAAGDFFPRYGITTPLRVAHFLAQAAAETGNFRWLREIWGPTDAQKGYEGRADLGNCIPGDGRKFLGRGINRGNPKSTRLPNGFEARKAALAKVKAVCR
jgi:hypothetical protein